MQTFIILLILVVGLGAAYYFLFMRKVEGKQDEGNQANSAMPNQDAMPMSQSSSLPADAAPREDNHSTP